jgi:exodeoxyribonuclease VII, large subunit
MNSEKYLSVEALTRYLKHKFDSDEHLRHVFLKGEISNLKMHSTGHIYFSIKDEKSKINAIMFSSSAQKLNFNPKEGTKVLVEGRITVYEATGGYQIYVDEMTEDGVGSLFVKFEKLKEDLAKEGLFDEKYKKKIPKIPNKIGIITAPTGAAIKDILSTIKRRYPICETYLFPALVQGEYAASDIVKKLKQADDFELDVIIIGRGGGSIEDLWSFNEEIVAKAIFETKTPIVSAVGHEVDFTISDFVADLRAPTPTGAAEMVVPNILDLEKELLQYNIRLKESIYKKININKLHVDSLLNSYVIKNPLVMYDNKKQNLDALIEKINTFMYTLIQKKKMNFENIKNHYLLKTPNKIYEPDIKKLKTIIEKLEIINPLNVLKRGYSMTYLNDKVVSSVKSIKEKDKLILKMADGQIETVVKKVSIKDE